jgi:3-oxoacyl-[acyl-carrier protein] reductase
MRLKNKTVILTGAAQGIGEATARLFVREGAILALIDRQAEALKKLSAELGENSAGFVIDITDKTAVSNTVTEIIARFGKIDVLINNAGITRDAMTEKMPEEDWDLVNDINLKAPFILGKEVFPYMREKRNGVILNAASVSALGNIGQANYAASKAGIIGLTKTWALEFARCNIRVNAVAPGFTETDMIKTLPDNIREKLTAKIPLKRFAMPAEIAGLYCFLASDEASYITGQTFYMDGGLTCGF